MKQKAIKAAVLVAVGLFLCVLISRAVNYMTAPKAQFVTLQQKVVYKEYMHKGLLEYGPSDMLVWKDALKRPMQVTDVHIKPGDAVQKGDLLFTFQLFQDVKAEKAALEKELRMLAQSKTTLYETLLKAKADLNSREVKLAQAYVDINSRMPVLEKLIQDNLPADTQENGLTDEKALQKLMKDQQTSKELAGDIQEYLSLKDRLEKLQPSLKKELRWGSNTDYKFALQWAELLTDIDAKAQQIAELEELQKQPLTYSAPMDGRVTALYAHTGDVYNGTTPLMAMTEEAFPVITIPKTEVSMDDSYMMNDYTIQYKGKTYECSVKDIEEDKLVLEPDSALFKADTTERLLGTTFEVQAATEKKVAAALPISAIHRRLEKDYIYIVRKEKGFWEDEYRIEEKEVDVPQYNDSYAAIATMLQEDTLILDHWDRAVQDGQRVYPYAE